MLRHLGSIRMQLLHVLDIIYNFNNICRRLDDPPPLSNHSGTQFICALSRQELLLFLWLVTRNHHHRHETCGCSPVPRGCGRAGHAHLSSLKMVGAEISTEVPLLLLLLRTEDIFMRVQLPGQRHFKCHALPPITFVSPTHCLLLAAHYGLKNVKHVDCLDCLGCFVPWPDWKPLQAGRVARVRQAAAAAASASAT